MSSGFIGKTTNHPDDVAGSALADERYSVWGEIDGQIRSFDPIRQTATVQPLYRPKFNGKPVDMPELLEVPVRFARAGNGALTYPVAPGDKVVLRPKMRSSELYHTDGDGAASDARSFSLSDMEAHLDGGESLQDPIPNFDAANTHLRFDPDGNFGVRGSADGKVAIEGAEGNLYDLLVQVVELLAGETTTVSGGSSTGIWPLTHQAQFGIIAAKLRGSAL